MSVCVCMYVFECLWWLSKSTARIRLQFFVKLVQGFFWYTRISELKFLISFRDINYEAQITFTKKINSLMLGERKVLHIRANTFTYQNETWIFYRDYFYFWIIKLKFTHIHFIVLLKLFSIFHSVDLFNFYSEFTFPSLMQLTNLCIDILCENVPSKHLW